MLGCWPLPNTAGDHTQVERKILGSSISIAKQLPTVVEQFVWAGTGIGVGNTLAEDTQEMDKL